MPKVSSTFPTPQEALYGEALRATPEGKIDKILSEEVINTDKVFEIAAGCQNANLVARIFIAFAMKYSRRMGMSKAEATNYAFKVFWKKIEGCEGRPRKNVSSHVVVGLAWAILEAACQVDGLTEIIQTLVLTPKTPLFMNPVSGEEEARIQHLARCWGRKGDNARALVHFVQDEIARDSNILAPLGEKIVRAVLYGHLSKLRLHEMLHLVKSAMAQDE